MVKKKMHCVSKKLGTCFDCSALYHLKNRLAPVGKVKQTDIFEFSGSGCDKTVISVGRNACCSEWVEVLMGKSVPSKKYAALYSNNKYRKRM